jgi:ABC-type branched-subunit amino acid transport system ATPase component/ABC-type branched-subunit amino acid transport system permease subunit
VSGAVLGVLGLDITFAGVVLGAIIGMTYGILAVGLILIYRSNKIINFAHGQIGAFGAAVLALAVVRWHFPYWLALPLALGASSAMGAGVEAMVIRRLRRAPRLMSIVATLGAAQFVLLFSLVIAQEVRSSSTFPQPQGLPEFDIGALRVTPAYSGMLFLTPLVVLALVVFLRRTRYGLAIRGSAANPETARLVGISASRMSTIAWAIAGAISAYTAILVFPSRGLITADSLGPALLLRALVAAVIGRMQNMPVALAAGVAVGIAEQVLLFNVSSGGLTEMLLFAGIVIALLFQTRQQGRGEERGSWTAVLPWKPLPDAFRTVWSIRNLGAVAGAAALAVAIVIPLFTSNQVAFSLIAVVSFSLIGLSIAVVTGMAGQLSLGQFALAGVGATVSYRLTAAHGNYLLGFLAAGIAAALVSAVIGLPALRIRGLMLAVVTLGFAVAAQTWLLQQPWMLGGRATPGRPSFFGFTLDSARKYYFFALALLVLGLVVYRNVRRGAFGRSLIALRDNEDAARAFTIPVTRRKLEAFALAGFLAGVGGAVYGHSLAGLSFETFSPDASIKLVAMAVIGGIGTLVGPVLGALYIVGIPAFVPLDTAGLAASAFGWLILILYYPGGLAEMVRPLRDRLVDALARAGGLDPVATRAQGEVEVDFGSSLSGGRSGPAETAGAGVDGTGAGAEPILVVTDLRKHWGGVRAVDGVSLSVAKGETLGLIGPNGAGKTTLFELIAGFTAPDTGRVVLDGRDVSGLDPAARGRAGLIRSFQDAALFPTLTVLDTVRLAFEREMPTRLGPELLGFTAADRRRDSHARELVHLMGLDHYRNKMIAELSTGTRRITELAALIALRPRVLLLDEPSSGIAQRETEALGEVLARLKSYLDATLLLIEHDMTLIMGLSDRVVAMESGCVIAEGLPAEVQSNPRVVESYLGTDVRAIKRSGTAAGVAEDDDRPRRRRRPLRAGAVD